MNDSVRDSRFRQSAVGDSRSDLTRPLEIAFSVPETGGFDHLLAAISNADERRCGFVNGRGGGDRAT